MPDGAQVELGHVIKAQYCAICYPFVEMMNVAIDEHHTDLAEKWTKERNRLRKICRKALGPNARLPDE